VTVSQLHHVVLLCERRSTVANNARIAQPGIIFLSSEGSIYWQGKDGLALKAARGEAVAADLARQCPLLTPQQLYRLTEHYDNDWAVGARAAVALTVLRHLYCEDTHCEGRICCTTPG